MDQTARPVRRRNADYRWTRDKMLAFLRLLARGASVTEAGRNVGMSRQSAYRLRSRLGVGFAQVWDEAVRFGAIARSGHGRSSEGDTEAAQGDTRAAR